MHMFVPDLAKPVTLGAICPLAKQRKLSFPNKNHLSTSSFGEPAPIRIFYKLVKTQFNKKIKKIQIDHGT